jgi:hypothetical protein
LLADGSPTARAAILRMQPLFAIAAESNGQPPEARLATRQARPVPVMADLHAWLATTLRRIADHPINRIGAVAPWTLRPDAA